VDLFFSLRGLEKIFGRAILKVGGRGIGDGWQGFLLNDMGEGSKNYWLGSSQDYGP